MDAESEFTEVLRHHFPRTKDAKIAEIVKDLFAAFEGLGGITDTMAHIPVRTIELANAVIEVAANDCMVNVLAVSDVNSDIQALL
jgi:hypothetical protein